MKKWIKKHIKQLITIIGVLFIINAVFGLLVTKDSAIFAFHCVGIALWLIILGLIQGIFAKIYDWWQKD